MNARVNTVILRNNQTIISHEKKKDKKTAEMLFSRHTKQQQKYYHEYIDILYEKLFLLLTTFARELMTEYALHSRILGQSTPAT
ncbi:hypothetical protein A9B99_10635 [Mangrovibacter phragmitis]|uniref:Uncharacterized protein n=1 Tax=Mangrovibacter phragmitis TaxID=1691903 RepID=A0A1B7L180_9ENTR|nr:hypothetical protein A9B99_10635 [Mangrovibacter phragmitis]